VWGLYHVMASGLGPPLKGLKSENVNLKLNPFTGGEMSPGAAAAAAAAVDHACTPTNPPAPHA